VSKAQKRLQKAKNNPKGWHFDELKRLYETFGFDVRSAKGSHHVATHPDLDLRLTFPSHSGELPASYVTNAVEAIEILLRKQGGQNESE